MPGREKVIKELECCVSLNHNGSKCANCDYADEFHNGDCETYLLSDALALLKVQEPVEPKIVDTDSSKLYNNDMFKNYYCGNCGEFLHVVNRNDLFCSQCGKVVKWE